jgi:hypothetical protein
MQTNTLQLPRFRRSGAVAILDDNDLDTEPGFSTTIVSRAVPIVPREPSRGTLSTVLTLVREVDSFLRAFDLMASSTDHLEALDAVIAGLVLRCVPFRAFVGRVSL